MYSYRNFELLKLYRLQYRADMPSVTNEQYDDLYYSVLNDKSTPEGIVNFLKLPLENDPIDESFLKRMGCEAVYEKLTEGTIKESTHKQVMALADFSILKIESKEDIEKFIERLGKDETYLASLKKDGVRGNAEFESQAPNLFKRTGVFSRGSSGNSMIRYADAAYVNIPNIVNMNVGAQAVPAFVVAGEFWINEDDLLEVSTLKGYQYSSTLHAASACAQTGIGNYSDELLNFSAFRILGLDIPTKTIELALLERLGFHTVPYLTLKPPHDVDEILRNLVEFRERMTNAGIPNDGVVLALDKNTGSMTEESIAIKLSEWVVKEHSGIISGFEFGTEGIAGTSRILLEPSDKHRVTSINAYNPGEIISRKLRVGDEVHFIIHSRNSVKWVMDYIANKDREGRNHGY